MPLRTLTESVDRLEQESHRVRDELTAVREELRRKTMTTRLAIGAVTLLMACTIVAAFQVSLDNKRQIDESQRRWCPVVEPLAPRASDPPPVGTPEQQERSQRIRTAFAQLVKEFGCTAP
jgi:hypothetical protein